MFGIGRLFASINGGAANGGHSISKGSVLAPTSGEVPTPINPRIIGTVRSYPVLTKPRYFTSREAGALEDLARVTEEQVKTTQKAYSALSSIERSDAQVHGIHRQYQADVAAAELSKQTADAGLAKTLHGQRAAYASLGYGIDRADKQATAAIARIRQRLNEI